MGGGRKGKEEERGSGTTGSAIAASSRRLNVVKRRRSGRRRIEHGQLSAEEKVSPREELERPISRGIFSTGRRAVDDNDDRANSEKRPRSRVEP